MVYLVSTIITILLSFIEISTLPRLLPWFLSFFLTLPFLAIISLKDKTIYPIFLALFAGLIFDAASVERLPIFSISFIVMMLFSKLFFSKDVTYGNVRNSIILVTIGVVSIYLLSSQTIIDNFLNYRVYLIVAESLVITIIITAALQRIFRKYFDWVEKTTAERFR